jgi:hypothetical protein
VVNPARIANFKRTSRYTVEDFDLLTRLIAHLGGAVVTLPHILAEVSNLTSLSGPELVLARIALKQLVSVVVAEHQIQSSVAADDPLFESLGLTDAAISASAKSNGWWVLTDDLDLYLRLVSEYPNVQNFSHLREARWSASTNAR